MGRAFGTTVQQGNLVMHEHVFRLAAILLAAAAPACPAIGQQEYVWEGGEWAEAAEPGEQTPAGQIALIRLHMDQDDNGDAVDAAEQFLETYPDHPDCEQAMMLAGQAEMNRGRYVKAYDWFERQLGRYPSGRYARRALDREYGIADAFLEGRKRKVLGFIPVPAKGEGLRILDGIVAHAPGSELAEDALLRIGDYHYGREEYAKAVDAYDRYVEMFPSGERASYAALRAARATHAMYEGPAFDDTPLVEARLRFRHFAERFPQAALENNTGDVLRRIAAQQAEKAVHTADYYHRVGRPNAAAFYYRQVLEHHGQTEWAARARRSLERMHRRVPGGNEAAQEPVEPPDRRDITGPTGLESLADDEDSDNRGEP
jgi:outer membrane assembly lipoprotein YfiO